MTVEQRRMRRGGISGGAVAAILVGVAVLLVLGITLGRGADSKSRAETTAAKTGQQNAPAAKSAPTSTDKPAASMQVTPAAAATTPDDEEAAAPRVPYVFEPPRLEFGYVNPGATLTGAFTIRNAGSEPLVIRAMRASCSCTTLEDLSGTVIAPGQAREVRPQIELPNAIGTKTAKVRFLFSMGSVEEQVDYDIHASMSRAVAVEPAYLVGTQAISGELHVHSLDEQPFRILSVNGNPVTYAGNFDPQKDPPRAEYRVTWDLSSYNARTCVNAKGERMPRWWVIETDHPECPVLDVQVRHNPCTRSERPTTLEQWILDDKRVVVNDVKPGQAVEAVAKMKWIPKSTPSDTIRAAETKSDQFEASLVRVEREEDVLYCHLLITPNPNHRGLIIGEVVLLGYAPDHHQTLAIIGRVTE